MAFLTIKPNLTSQDDPTAASRRPNLAGIKWLKVCILEYYKFVFGPDCRVSIRKSSNPKRPEGGLYKCVVLFWALLGLFRIISSVFGFWLEVKTRVVYVALFSLLFSL